MSAISKFKITPVTDTGNGVVALCSVGFYNAIICNSITIRKSNTDGKYYVRMPNKRTMQGNFIDVIHPLNRETRLELNNTLLTAFMSGNLEQKFTTPPPTIYAQNSFNYKGDFGKLKSRMDIVVNDMVIHNCHLYQANDNMFISLPSYKGGDGEYHSLVIANSKDTYELINSAAIDEYKSEFAFKKCSDDEVAKIKDAGIRIASNKNEAGENIIKFKVNDVDKINNALSQGFKQQI